MAATTTPKTPRSRSTKAAKEAAAPVEPAELTEDDLELTDAELEQAAAEADEDLLADLPELAAPGRLRIVQQNLLKRASYAAQPVFAALRAIRANRDGSVSLSESEYNGLLDLVEKIDAFAEAIAVDKEAYAEWALGKTDAHYFALLGRYTRAQGE